MPLLLRMPKDVLPVYAIVELLIRLTDFEPQIGDYRGHRAVDDQVIVKTTNGSIILSNDLVLRQFHTPENITTDELIRLAASFNRGVE